MPARVQKAKAKAKRPEEEETTMVAADVQAVKNEMDDILADIDEVLELNAEEFVKSYVQKGGE